MYRYLSIHAYNIYTYVICTYTQTALVVMAIQKRQTDQTDSGRGGHTNCKHTYIPRYVRTRTYINTYIYTYTYVHIHLHKLAQAHIPAYRFTYVHAHICMHA